MMRDGQQGQQQRQQRSPPSGRWARGDQHAAAGSSRSSTAEAVGGGRVAGQQQHARGGAAAQRPLRSSRLQECSALVAIGSPGSDILSVTSLVWSSPAAAAAAATVCRWAAGFLGGRRHSRACSSSRSWCVVRHGWQLVGASSCSPLTIPGVSC
uniref:Uncharacterized protein n=1 Tax=Tetradesmus obliquus TaxID=3088 RepID=A0A383V3S7_TETOB